MPTHTWTLPAPADFSYAETLQAHGWRRLLPFTWREETQTLERVTRLADGQVILVTLRPQENNTLAVTVSEDADRDEIDGQVRRMLQWDIPLEGFHAFCASRPELAHVPDARKGRLLISPTAWEDYAKVVLTTNTTWAQTIAMTARVVNAYGSGLAADMERRAFPTPAQVAAVPLETFAATARLGYRAPSIHAVATRIAAGTLDLERLRERALPAADVWKTLLALPGVGPYAAACLCLYLGRYERVNVDSWARALVSKEVGRPVTDKETHAFFDDYGEWRALVYHVYPWKEAP